MLDQVPAQLSGMTVQVVYSATQQLVLANPTDEPVEVLEPDGTPFLRIGPEGVLVNLNARSWYTTNDPFGQTPVPEDVLRLLAEDPKPAPRWGRVSRQPSWGWFDHRLHPATPTVPPQVVEAGVPADLQTWTVPVRHLGRTLQLKGRIVYRPLRGVYRFTLAGGERTATPVPGVEVSILEGRGVPAVFLKNTSGQEVVVFDAQDEPFLRITGAGVEADTRSLGWAEVRRAEGEPVAGAPPHPPAPPEWSVVASQNSYAWPEPRGSYGAEEPPEDTIRLGVPVDVRTWRIPLSVGGQRHLVEAVTQWVPADDRIRQLDGDTASAAGPRRTAVRAALAALAALALACAEITRRRRLGA
ncbi:MAG: hypothetical protein ACRD0K_16365 [Egibacteraceae bacterium]